MDATVNDFFKEINQLSSNPSSKPQSEVLVWQECYDELTGYSYFWNTDTDEVTWEPPKSYKPAENVPKKASALKLNVEKEKKKPELFVPPPSTPYSTTVLKPEAKVKVYSIQEVINKPVVKQHNNSVSKTETKPPVKKRPFRKCEESDDEKIELITEYGRGSDSDSDDNTTHVKDLKNKPKQKPSPVRKQLSPRRSVDSPTRKMTATIRKPTSRKHSESHSDSNEDDDIDLLAKIQQRAQELKKLGGEVPPSVKKIIQNNDTKETLEKPISGFSLVAGYNSGSSDSETDQQEDIPPKPVFPVAPPPKPIPETSHSTLFPIPESIDVRDFIGPEPSSTENDKLTETTDSTTNFDNKAFQRKRRIGISLMNNAKRPKDDEHESSKPEFAGFGFKTDNSSHVENDTKEETRNVYGGFQKGGVMFVKSDVLNLPPEEKQVVRVKSPDSDINRKETEEDYTVLREKLSFLGEGREPVLPVQAMLIQAETLFLAMTEGGLKLSYLHKWLKDMCSELVKLEQEAAPDGWLLQWDRIVAKATITTGINNKRKNLKLVQALISRLHRQVADHRRRQARARPVRIQAKTTTEGNMEESSSCEMSVKMNIGGNGTGSISCNISTPQGNQEFIVPLGPDTPQDGKKKRGRTVTKSTKK